MVWVPHNRTKDNILSLNSWNIASIISLTVTYHIYMIALLVDMAPDITIYNIVAAFRGMHVSPVKHSYAWLPRKCDYRTDTQTDRRWTKWSLCATMLCRRPIRAYRAPLTGPDTIVISWRVICRLNTLKGGAWGEEAITKILPCTPHRTWYHSDILKIYL